MMIPCQTALSKRHPDHFIASYRQSRIEIRVKHREQLCFWRKCPKNAAAGRWSTIFIENLRRMACPSCLSPTKELRIYGKTVVCGRCSPLPRIQDQLGSRLVKRAMRAHKIGQKDVLADMLQGRTQEQMAARIALEVQNSRPTTESDIEIIGYQSLRTTDPLIHVSTQTMAYTNTAVVDVLGSLRLIAVG